MRFKQDIPTCSVSNYWRTKSLEREKRRGPKKKNNYEFMIHTANSVRIAIDAGNFNSSLHHCWHCIAYCQSY
jgi:hypothetical protein